MGEPSVLDGPAVFQPEDVDVLAAAAARFGHIVDLQNHKIVVSENALDLSV